MAQDKESAKKKTKRPTAQKRDIQNAKKNLINKSFKSQVRTAITTLEKAVKSSDKSNVTAQINSVYSLMDKGVKKGVFKLNKAARIKSRLSKFA